MLLQLYIHTIALTQTDRRFEFFPLKTAVAIFSLYARTAHCVVIPISLKQYLVVCQMATIQCVDLQCLTLLYKNNVQQLLFQWVFILHIVCSNKILVSRPHDSPHNVMYISDIELYITERNKGVLWSLGLKMWYTFLKYKIKPTWRKWSMDCITVARKYHSHKMRVGQHNTISVEYGRSRYNQDLSAISQRDHIMRKVNI